MIEARRQIPRPGETVLDHVGLFVPDMDVTSETMARLGFALTPLTRQSHAQGPGLAAIPAGTANRLALLSQGYLEVLTPTADMPLAAQMRRAIDRYTGLHLIAFGSADADADHARLAEAGFAPLPVVRLERRIDTEDGERRVRFSVVRVPPERMPEGRIQYCQHHTPELVWQQRWLDQPNRAHALTDVLLCVEDPAEASARFGRFVGRAASPAGDGAFRLDLDRGRLSFVEPERLRAILPVVEVPTTPFIAAGALSASDPDATRRALRHGRIRFSEPAPGAIVAEPPGFTATVVFTAGDALPPWTAPTWAASRSP